MRQLLLLLIIYLAFISLGLPDGALGVAWPTMRHELGQPLEAAGLLTLVATSCSALSGLLSGRIQGRWGTGPVVLVSGLLTGFAVTGYSYAPSFAWLLVLALPLGLGAGAVDAALNHYAAGNYSSRHMSWLHGCWGVGATLGPVILGEALREGDGWRDGYYILGIVQCGLALLFLSSLPLWRDSRHLGESHEVNGAVAAASPDLSGLDPRPAHGWVTWEAASLFFFYVVLETVPSLWAVTILVEQRAVDKVTAAFWLSCFYGSLTGGRFVIGGIAAHVGNRVLVRYGLLTALFGAVIFATFPRPAELSLVGLVLLGLGCAPIYPALMHETPRRFDAGTARTVIGRQVALNYIGVAFLPAAFGVLGAHVGLWALMPGVIAAILLMLYLSERVNRMT